MIETRKTAPGLRVLDKWAVLAGGGANHRMGLFDMVMIKNNHVDAAGGVAPAVRACTVPPLAEQDCGGFGRVIEGVEGLKDFVRLQVGSLLGGRQIAAQLTSEPSFLAMRCLPINCAVLRCLRVPLGVRRTRVSMVWACQLRWRRVTWARYARCCS